jgi:hypothetical protein
MWCSVYGRMRNNMKKKVWVEDTLEFAINENEKQQLTCTVTNSEIKITDTTPPHYLYYQGLSFPIEGWSKLKTKVDEMISIRNAEIGTN